MGFNSLYGYGWPQQTQVGFAETAWTYALATSTGYAGRRPLPWLACNVARASSIAYVPGQKDPKIRWGIYVSIHAST